MGKDMLRQMARWSGVLDSHGYLSSKYPLMQETGRARPSMINSRHGVAQNRLDPTTRFGRRADPYRYVLSVVNDSLLGGPTYEVDVTACAGNDMRPVFAS